jgi:hypothetical protein
MPTKVKGEARYMQKAPDRDRGIMRELYESINQLRTASAALAASFKSATRKYLPQERHHPSGRVICCYPVQRSWRSMGQSEFCSVRRQQVK